MQQLELFESKIAFAARLDIDELKKIRRHNYEAYQKLGIVRNIMSRMAMLGKHEDFRTINCLNHVLDKKLANM